MVINLQINLNRPRWSRNWSLRRKVMVFLALALLLPPATYVAANDIFSDVPNSSGFHDVINAIYGARITVGCGNGNYCPGALVTREQMAAFLQRGLPRVGYNAVAQATLTNTFQDRGVVTITTGGVAGGTGFVKLDASVLAFNSAATGCPCEVEFLITQDGGSQNTANFVTVYNDQGGVDGNATGSLTWAVSVPTASTQTFRLKVRQNNGTAGVPARGAITALYVPFGSTGGSTF